MLYGDSKNLGFCNPDFKDPKFREWLSKQWDDEGFIDKLGHEDVKNILTIVRFIDIVLKKIRIKHQDAQMQRNAYLGAHAETLTRTWCLPQ